MSQSLKELKQDLVEVDRLLNLALRQNCKDLLTAEKVRLQQKIKEVKVNDEPQKAKTLPTKTLTSYAWDQSDKFVKIYLSDLKGIQSISKENVELSSTDEHYSVLVKNLNGVNYQFSCPKLLHPVSDFTCKVKENMLLLMLKKTSQQKWNYLSKREQEAKEEKEKSVTSGMDKDVGGDPQASIMNMMKKMYDEGDDEMKKTIAKAWTESSQKQRANVDF